MNKKRKVLLIAVSILTAVLLCALSSCRTLDKSELKAALDRKAYNSGYTNESWKAYSDVYNEALEVYKSSSTTQSIIDDVTLRLISAYNKLTKSVDFSTLESALASFVGPEGYTSESYAAYKEAYDKAKDLYEHGSNVLQSEINDAINALKKAYAALEKELDLSEIKALIATSVERSLYTSASYGRYAEALDAAKALIASSDIKPLYLTMATDELRNSMEALVTRGDVSKLSKALVNVNKYYSGELPAGLIPPGRLPEIFYTVSSYTKLGTLIDKANAFVLSGDIGDEDIVTLISDLNVAVAELTPRADTAPLLDAITAAQAYSSQDYTADSYAVLDNALTRANNLLASGKELTEAEIELAANDIISAINSLVLLRVTPTGRDDYDFKNIKFHILNKNHSLSEYKHNGSGLATYLKGADVIGLYFSSFYDEKVKLSDGSEADDHVFILRSGLRVDIINNSLSITKNDEGGLYIPSGASVAGVDLSFDFKLVIDKLGEPSTYGKNSAGAEITTYIDKESAIVLTFEFVPDSDELRKITVDF